MDSSLTGILGATERPALLSYVRDRRCVLFVERDSPARPAIPDGARSWRPSCQKRSDTRRLLRRRASLPSYWRPAVFPSSPPKATHRAIVQTPYAAIVTTNFDTLLEDAYARWSDEGVPKAPTGAQLGRHGTLLLDRAFFILKAHGTFHDEESLVFTSEDYRRITHANPAFQSMMAAILLTHAVLFVGYSLSDPNFRLLLEGQLAVFGTQAPPRYVLMEGVGTLEADILRRTAGIEVISYPHGEHATVADFLGRVASPAQSPTGTGRARAKVLRKRAPLAALRLSIRPRDAMLDVEWFETTTDDLAGVRVPLGDRYMASTTSLPWTELLRMSRVLLPAYSRNIGELVARPLTHLGVPLVTPGAPRLLMLDVPEELAAVPWEWVQVNGRPLCMQVPTCRTVPWLDDASRGRPFFHDPSRVLLVGDALAESERIRHPLPGTHQEVEAISRCFRTASKRHEVTVLVGTKRLSSASCGRWPMATTSST
jgi:hypothetical protein